MLLEVLELENFRQYYGRQRVEFSNQREKQVTVVYGDTGTGKTTLLTALVWCLYGRGDADTDGIANRRALKEAQLRANVETSVQLAFSHRGTKYTATRVVRFTKLGDSEWKRTGEPTFALAHLKSDGQSVFLKDEEGDAAIEKILPWVVCPYFFFDGERIDRFVKPEHEGQVEKAIRNILHIEVLERTRVHLAKVERNYQLALQKYVSGDVKQALDLLGRKKDEEDKLSKDIERLKEERKACVRQLNDIVRRLSELREARLLQEQRVRLQEKQKTLENELERLWRATRDKCTEAYLGLLCNTMGKAQALLDEKRRQGDIPPGIREQFLRDLLKRGICICGRSVDARSSEYKRIAGLLKDTVPTQTETKVTDTSAYLGALHENARSVLRLIGSQLEDKVVFEQQLVRLEEQLNELSQRLQDSGLQEASDLENGRKRLFNDERMFLGQISAKEALRLRVLEEIDELQKKVDRAQGLEEQARRMQLRHSLASRSARAVDSIIGAFAEARRKQVRDETSRIFSRLIWKTSQFPEMDLDVNYHLEVYDRWSVPAKYELSAGERQLLSLSLITGMSKVSGEEAPLVMDTPLARLSGAPRENVAKVLPDMTFQLVLLVTDEELRGPAKESINSRIGAEYQLRFDDSTGCTSIVSLRSK